MFFFYVYFQVTQTRDTRIGDHGHKIGYIGYPLHSTSLVIVVPKIVDERHHPQILTKNCKSLGQEYPVSNQGKAGRKT